MNKIEVLIKEVCPDGVEYKKVGELFTLSRGIVISKKYINDNPGPYPVYSSQTENNGELGKIETYNYDGEYLSWTTDGAYAGTVFYRNGKFNVTNVCGLLTPKTNNNIKYLYYALSIHTKEHVNIGMGNAKLMSNVMAQITIPLPPRAIQDEIVKILDNFTKLTTKLTTELKDRIKQYEYYRDKLLSFDDQKDKIEYKRVDELFNITRGAIMYKDYINKNPGPYPVYSSQTSNNGEFGRINTYAYDGEYLTWTTDGAYAGTVFYRNEKFSLTDRSGLLTPKTNNNIKYLYYALSIRTRDHVHEGMGNPKMNSNVMAKILLPIPPLPVQNSIAEVLDNFEKICKDLKIGLPSEIQLRQKQYEYYRNLLLSFNIDDIKRERERR
ncbi:restriction endonuclease subunit S [Mycoplasmopsis bovirhinis]|uniref:restriction endonuclease subunit S n=1 Tax=Mycoplasmopsis bovirhinis TaxID=29553 RepID=UPI000BB9E9E1|nr:restriction endonuclease subunit S [Mycoplasmopsis bovirhinis]BBA22125.1 restriction endonuclease subunit S [Mycoplasmopsis bovirhinis]